MSIQFRPVVRFEDPCGPVFYLGTLSPAEIKAVTFVPVVSLQGTDLPSALRLHEKAGGYQRAGDSKRMDDIKSFVLARRGCVIPPVVLSTRGQWRWIPDSPDSPVGSIVAAGSAAIVDGQHRLGGLWRVAVDGSVEEIVKQKPIPFMAVDGMDEAQETLEFVDINDNQKGVKKSLIAWLEKDNSFAGQAAHALAGDAESVFRGRIDTQLKHDWDLMLFGAAKECVEALFSAQLRTGCSFDPHTETAVREQAIEMMLTYWRLVSHCLHEFWADIDSMPPLGERKSQEHKGTAGFRFRLLEETGIRAFSRLGEKLFSAAWVAQLRAPSWEVVEAALRELGKSEKVRLVLTKPRRNPAVLELDPYLSSSGKAGVEAIYRHLESELLLLWSRSSRPGDSRVRET